jgi:hypothetical protein
MQEDTEKGGLDAIRYGDDPSETSGHLTTNLGVRSSNLFGRANNLFDFDSEFLRVFTSRHWRRPGSTGATPD